MNIVSIIIPTYNHANTLPRVLDAIFSQSYSDFEVIVVNDGSMDATVHALVPYMDRIRYFFQENQGAQSARNRGLKEAKGDFVMILDADVILRKNALQTLLNTLLEHPQSSYAYGRFYFGWKSFHNYVFSAERLRKMNYIHTSALVRTKDHPGFDESIKRFQDWDVWLTMLEQGKTGIFVPEYIYDICVDGVSRIGIVMGTKRYGTKWIPSFIYKLPWKWIGYTPPLVRAYMQGRDHIARKHNLSL